MSIISGSLWIFEIVEPAALPLSLSFTRTLHTHEHERVCPMMIMEINQIFGRIQTNPLLFKKQEFTIKGHSNGLHFCHISFCPKLKRIRRNQPGTHNRVAQEKKQHQEHLLLIYSLHFYSYSNCIQFQMLVKCLLRVGTKLKYIHIGYLLLYYL